VAFFFFFGAFVFLPQGGFLSFSASTYSARRTRFSSGAILAPAEELPFIFSKHSFTFPRFPYVQQKTSFDSFRKPSSYFRRISRLAAALLTAVLGCCCLVLSACSADF